MRALLLIFFFLLFFIHVRSRSELFCFDFEPKLNDIVHVNTGVNPSDLLEIKQVFNEKTKSSLASFLSSKSNFYSFFSDGKIEIKFPSNKDGINLPFKNIKIISEYIPISSKICSMIKNKNDFFFSMFCSCSSGDIVELNTIKPLEKLIKSKDQNSMNNVYLYDSINSYSHSLPHYLSSPKVCLRESLCSDKDNREGLCRISIPNLSDSPCLLVTFNDINNNQKVSIKNFFTFSFHIPTLLDIFPPSFIPGKKFNLSKFSSIIKEPSLLSKISKLKNIMVETIKEISYFDDLLLIFKQFLGVIFSFIPLYFIILLFGIVLFHYSSELSESKFYQLFLQVAFSIILSFFLFMFIFHKLIDKSFKKVGISANKSYFVFGSLFLYNFKIIFSTLNQSFLDFWKNGMLGYNYLGKFYLIVFISITLTIFQYFKIFHEDKPYNIKALSVLTSITGFSIIMNTYLNGKISIFLVAIFILGDKACHYIYWKIKCYEQKEEVELCKKSVIHISSNELSKKIRSNTDIELEKLRNHFIRNPEARSQFSNIYKLQSRFKSNLLLSNFIDKTYDGYSYIYDDEKKQKSYFYTYIYLGLLVLVIVFLIV